MYLTSASLWLAILHISHYGLVSAGRLPLGPRDYSLRDYYALHLTSDVSPVAIAQQLGLQHEGLIGELDDHHLFSAPRGNVDIVSTRLERDRRRRKRSLHSGVVRREDISDSILFAQKQKLKQLVKRIPPGKREGLPAVTSQSWDENDQIQISVDIKNVVKTLDIKDPIFADQWHLVSPYVVTYSDAKYINISF